MGNKNAKQKKVDEWLKQQKQKDERLFRVLLLGPGDSGKSTILKQMRRIEQMHKQFGSNGEHTDSIPLIREAILIYMHILCKSNKLLLAASEFDDGGVTIDESIKADIAVSDKVIELRDYFAKTKITRFDANDGDDDGKAGYDDDDNNLEFLFRTFTKLAQSHIKPLWEDQGIKNTIKYRAMFADQIPDSAVYFLDRIEEIAEDDYDPSFEDFVRLRTKTSGAQIVNIEIDLDKLSDHDDKSKFGVFNFEFTDIGGQASERNKWARVMNDQISVVLFVAAISEYDLPCYEDISKRRMADALDAFRKLMTHNLGPKGPKFVENKQVFVLFNKFDLLPEKLEKVPLQSIEEFSDFTYDAKEEDVDLTRAVTEYFEDKFLEVIADIKEKDAANADPKYVRLNFNTEKQLSFHTSEALDTKLIQQLFHKIMLHVVTGNLERMGMASDTLM